MPFIVISLLLAAAIGGGVSIVARDALPGEPLWIFKVGVMERLQDMLAADGRAQADFDITVIEARMIEAEKLGADGKFSPGVKVKIESNFESRAQSVREQITKLDGKGDYGGAANIAARFQAVLVNGAAGILDVREMLDTSSILSAETSEKVKQ